MNLMGTPADNDNVARDIMDEISRVNALMGTHNQPEWVDVQVGYRLVGTDSTFREDAIRQQAPEVPEILSRLVRHIKLAYGQMSVDAVANGRQRLITFDIADLLYVEVTSVPFVPEQNQDDERRRNLRRTK